MTLGVCKAVETRRATVTTGITHLTEDGPIYRGRLAIPNCAVSPVNRGQDRPVVIRRLHRVLRTDCLDRLDQ